MGSFFLFVSDSTQATALAALLVTSLLSAVPAKGKSQSAVPADYVRTLSCYISLLPPY